MEKIRAKDVVFLLKLVYKNMIWNRPKWALGGLIAVALLTTLNGYINLARDFGKYGTTGRVMELLFVLGALSAWFCFLPFVFYLIDTKKSPKRIRALTQTISQ